MEDEIKKKIEEDFSEFDEQELEKFFDKFKNDKRTMSFIEYYNKTVLDKTKIKFSEFSYQWALHLPKKFYSEFDKDYDFRVSEIKNKKDIKDFFKRFCIYKYTKDGEKKQKRMGSFCSKLFHTFLPKEFPPVDNPIKKRFNLQNEDFITSTLLIKRCYELFIKENSKLINLIRNILSKSKFSYLRINELSDIRILDMYYWFKLNREG